MRSDNRFEIPAARHMGMVVFRLKGDCAMTEKLLKKLNSRLDIEGILTHLYIDIIAVVRCMLCHVVSRGVMSSDSLSPVKGPQPK